MNRLEEIKNRYRIEFQPYSMSTITDMNWLIEKLEKAIELANRFAEYKPRKDASIIEMAINQSYAKEAREFLKDLGE